MIYILDPHGDDSVATLAEKLDDIFSGVTEANYLNSEDLLIEFVKGFNGVIQPNDIFIFSYKEGAPLPGAIADFLSDIRASAPVIPLSLDGSPKPPEPFSAIKSINYDLEPLKRRIEVLLGYMLRRKGKSIFISYRESDGAQFAQQLHDFLNEQGFSTWKDTASDRQGFEEIEPGEDVQKIIEGNIEKAALVLLLDTPDMPQSPWVKEEINAAIANNIPVLPVHVRDGSLEPVVRSSVLRGICRYVDIVAETTFDNSHLNKVLGRLEGFLLDLYRTNLSITVQSKNIFEDCDYDWNIIDLKKSLYSSEKETQRSPKSVISHCSQYSGVFDSSAVALHLSY